ncbi:MAG: AMP-dependent synthetase and ligase [Anaeromyxobacteraceae bacterium]|nr:AMP-dependent synthetase and ligase [Anaeromyxobacteraceae bacterium]
MVRAPTMPTPRTLQLQRFPDRTLPALLRAIARRRPDATFLRVLDGPRRDAPPRDVTFSAFEQGVRRAAASLSRAGLRAGDRVLMLADNSPAWQEISLGAQALRAEPAALFSSLAGEPARAIALRVKPRVAFVSGPSQWEKLAPAAGELVAAGLVAVVTTEPLAAGAVPPGVRVLTAAEVSGEAAASLDDAAWNALVDAVGEEDPFLMIFTSGTTGRPKGVRLPQRSIVHAIDAGNLAVGTSQDDLGVHFLPFAHVAGHDQFFLAVAQGHALVLVLRREDIERSFGFGPTYAFSVPLIYDRFRTAVEAKVESLRPPLRRLARAALAAGVRVRVEGSRSLVDRLLTRLADRLVGGPLREKLGGRIRALFSGGAPASPALFRFLEGLGIPCVELNGMTETGGMVSSNLLHGKRRPGCAGVLTPDHEVRFDVDGELLLRGPLLFSGYLEPEDDAGAFTADGFYRTGDRARIDEEGFLRVEGRKKHLLVLSTGKKLAPEPLEQAIAGTPPFQGAVLLGEGRPFVSAAVFVAPDFLARLAAEGRDAAEALLPVVRSALHAFSDYEKPHKLLVIPGSPADHPSIVTPTLKVKREAVIAFLGPRLAALYEPRVKPAAG